MRVLTVGNLYPPAASGGYERTWAAVVAGLQAAGHPVEVLTTSPVAGRPADPGADPAWVRRELRWYWRDFAFERPRLRARLARERQNAAVLERRLREFRPDVVAWWGMGGMSLSLLERVRCEPGIGAVAVVEDAWLDYGRRADPWIAGWRRVPFGLRVAEVPTRVRLASAAHYLFASQWLAGQAATLRLERTSVVPLGVDPAAFPPQPARPWSWRLASVGRVEREKGIAVALEALALLPAQATLTVRGDGDAGHLAELVALAARLGVGGRVTFEPAAIGPVLDAYAAADAVVFPVLWPEPWGLVPLEAMSTGRPVIATGTGGSAEYLRDGENALLAPPGDARALAAAVRRLADEPALRQRLLRGGRETAAAYTEARFVRAVIAALAAEQARTTKKGSSGAR